MLALQPQAEARAPLLTCPVPPPPGATACVQPLLWTEVTDVASLSPPPPPPPLRNVRQAQLCLPNLIKLKSGAEFDENKLCSAAAPFSTTSYFEADDVIFPHLLNYSS